MAYNTIVVKGRGIRKEALAGAAITPGFLVKKNSAGAWIPHATALGVGQTAFAVENEAYGKEISVAYASGDTTPVEILDAGSEVYGFVKANAAAIVVGDYLESAGNGSFQKLTTGIALAVALEALDNSANGSMARLLMEVL